jgi:hypothetical protein
VEEIIRERVMHMLYRDMAIKINFVLFERTFKLYEDTFSYLAWFSKYFDQKQCAVRHLEFLMTSQAG